jgi:sugar O-acyltransferase (sialic acid O-acetyltransferase NeuD family)
MARDVYWLIQEINRHALTYQVVGFLEPLPQADHIRIGSRLIPVIAESKELFGSSKNAAFAIGIGQPALIEKVAKKYDFLDYPNLIHPSLICDFETLKMGKGNILTAGCVLTVNIHLGSFNILNCNAAVGHDTSIGNYNVINPGANISGGVKLGNTNLIGTNATVLQYLSIGNESVLGAASLLTKDLASGKVAVGVPAKLVGSNE